MMRQSRESYRVKIEKIISAIIKLTRDEPHAERIACKACGGGVVKNGMIRGKQRYRCKECGFSFSVCKN
jgi:transposase-like protein